MLVLAVQVDEQVPHRLEEGGGRGPSVHERPALPVGMNLAPKEEPSILGLDAEREQRLD